MENASSFYPGGGNCSNGGGCRVGWDKADCDDSDAETRREGIFEGNDSHMGHGPAKGSPYYCQNDTGEVTPRPQFSGDADGGEGTAGGSFRSFEEEDGGGYHEWLVKESPAAVYAPRSGIDGCSDDDEDDNEDDDEEYGESVPYAGEAINEGGSHDNGMHRYMEGRRQNADVAMACSGASGSGWQRLDNALTSASNGADICGDSESDGFQDSRDERAYLTASDGFPAGRRRRRFSAPPENDETGTVGVNDDTASTDQSSPPSGRMNRCRLSLRSKSGRGGGGKRKGNNNSDQTRKVVGISASYPSPNTAKGRYMSAVDYSSLAEQMPRVLGVHFDRFQCRWVSSYSEGGRTIKRYFSVFRYGFKAAHEFAIRHRWRSVLGNDGKDGGNRPSNMTPEPEHLTDTVDPSSSSHIFVTSSSESSASTRAAASAPTADSGHDPGNDGTDLGAIVFNEKECTAPVETNFGTRKGVRRRMAAAAAVANFERERERDRLRKAKRTASLEGFDEKDDELIVDDGEDEDADGEMEYDSEEGDAAYLEEDEDIEKGDGERDLQEGDEVSKNIGDVVCKAVNFMAVDFEGDAAMAMENVREGIGWSATGEAYEDTVSPQTKSDDVNPERSSLAYHSSPLSASSSVSFSNDGGIPTSSSGRPIRKRGTSFGSESPYWYPPTLAASTISHTNETSTNTVEVQAAASDKRHSKQRAKEIEDEELANRAKLLQRITGVTYDKQMRRWTASIVVSGRPGRRFFPLSRFDFLEARRKAVQCRLRYHPGSAPKDMSEGLSRKVFQLEGVGRDTGEEIEQCEKTEEEGAGQSDIGNGRIMDGGAETMFREVIEEGEEEGREQGREEDGEGADGEEDAESDEGDADDDVDDNYHECSDQNRDKIHGSAVKACPPQPQGCHPVLIVSTAGAAAVIEGCILGGGEMAKNVDGNGKEPEHNLESDGKDSNSDVKQEGDRPSRERDQDGDKYRNSAPHSGNDQGGYEPGGCDFTSGGNGGDEKGDDGEGGNGNGGDNGRGYIASNNHVKNVLSSFDEQAEKLKPYPSGLTWLRNEAAWELAVALDGEERWRVVFRVESGKCSVEEAYAAALERREASLITLQQAVADFPVTPGVTYQSRPDPGFVAEYRGQRVLVDGLLGPLSTSFVKCLMWINERKRQTEERDFLRIPRRFRELHYLIRDKGLTGLVYLDGSGPSPNTSCLITASVPSLAASISSQTGSEENSQTQILCTSTSSTPMLADSRCLSTSQEVVAVSRVDLPHSDSPPSESIYATENLGQNHQQESDFLPPAATCSPTSLSVMSTQGMDQALSPQNHDWKSAMTRHVVSPSEVQSISRLPIVSHDSLSCSDLPAPPQSMGSGQKSSGWDDEIEALEIVNFPASSLSPTEVKSNTLPVLTKPVDIRENNADEASHNSSQKSATSRGPEAVSCSSALPMTKTLPCISSLIPTHLNDSVGHGLNDLSFSATSSSTPSPSPSCPFVSTTSSMVYSSSSHLPTDSSATCSVASGVDSMTPESNTFHTRGISTSESREVVLVSSQSLHPHLSVSVTDGNPQLSCATLDSSLNGTGETAGISATVSSQRNEAAAEVSPLLYSQSSASSSSDCPSLEKSSILLSNSGSGATMQPVQNLCDYEDDVVEPWDVFARFLEELECTRMLIEKAGSLWRVEAMISMSFAGCAKQADEVDGGGMILEANDEDEYRALCVAEGQDFEKNISNGQKIEGVSGITYINDKGDRAVYVVDLTNTGMSVLACRRLPEIPREVLLRTAFQQRAADGILEIDFSTGPGRILQNAGLSRIGPIDVIGQNHAISENKKRPKDVVQKPGDNSSSDDCGSEVAAGLPPESLSATRSQPCTGREKVETCRGVTVTDDNERTDTIEDVRATIVAISGLSPAAQVDMLRKRLKLITPQQRHELEKKEGGVLDKRRIYMVKKRGSRGAYLAALRARHLILSLELIAEWQCPQHIRCLRRCMRSLREGYGVRRLLEIYLPTAALPPDVKKRNRTGLAAVSPPLTDEASLPDPLVNFDYRARAEAEKKRFIASNPLASNTEANSQASTLSSSTSTYQMSRRSSTDESPPPVTNSVEKQSPGKPSSTSSPIAELQPPLRTTAFASPYPSRSSNLPSPLSQTRLQADGIKAELGKDGLPMISYSGNKSPATPGPIVNATSPSLSIPMRSGWSLRESALRKRKQNGDGPPGSSDTNEGVSATLIKKREQVGDAAGSILSAAPTFTAVSSGGSQDSCVDGTLKVDDDTNGVGDNSSSINTGDKLSGSSSASLCDSDSCPGDGLKRSDGVGADICGRTSSASTTVSSISRKGMIEQASQHHSQHLSRQFSYHQNDTRKQTQPPHRVTELAPGPGRASSKLSLALKKEAVLLCLADLRDRSLMLLFPHQLYERRSRAESITWHIDFLCRSSAYSTAPESVVEPYVRLFEPIIFSGRLPSHKDLEVQHTLLCALDMFLLSSQSIRWHAALDLQSQHLFHNQQSSHRNPGHNNRNGSGLSREAERLGPSSILPSNYRSRSCAEISNNGSLSKNCVGNIATDKEILRSQDLAVKEYENSIVRAGLN